LTPIWDDNDQVALAIARLGAKIQELTGRTAVHLPLPRNAKGEHQGFDDYAVAQPAEALAYLNGEGVPVDIGELEMLKLKLNTKVCIVRSIKKVVDLDSGTIMSKAEFTDVNYADYVARMDDKVINVPKVWLADPRRLVVDEMDYIPGQERIANGCLNLWRGMGCDPAEGDVSRWLTLLEHNVPDVELRLWVLRWMAWPLQNSGQKLNTFVHLYGPPGTGKQALLAPLMRVYGGNAVVIAREHIAAQFNSVYANKQFINVDELHGGAGEGGTTINNKLKRLVTDGRMVVNMKNQPEYEVTNCANIVTTSNYVDSIKLDDDDSRCCVVRFGDRGTQKGREFWEDYFAWVEGVGAAAVYDYLLKLDIGEFDPKGWAPMTEDKVEITRATRRVDEQWVQSLWDDPDDVLTERNRCLFTSDELAAVCFSDDPQGVTPSKKLQLGIKMNGAGFPKVELKVNGKKVRFWVVRKRDADWTAEAARHHLKLFGFGGIK
jgi:hypothetical protein